MMNRPAYEYTVPQSAAFYPSNTRPPPQYERGFAIQHAVPQLPQLYSPSSHPLSNYADVYEGNNDTTLRAEERHWYIENHKTLQPQYDGSQELQHPEIKIKKEEEKKTDVVMRSDVSEARRKEDRCSCECWPNGETNVVQDETAERTSRSVSRVDMVASYGVYGQPNEDESAGFARLDKNAVFGQSSDTPAQNVVVNQQGNSAVVRSAPVTEVSSKCCVWSNNDHSADSEDYCWVTYCRPALILLLLVFFLVLLGVSTGFLLSNNCKYNLY